MAILGFEALLPEGGLIFWDRKNLNVTVKIKSLILMKSPGHSKGSGGLESCSFVGKAMDTSPQNGPVLRPGKWAILTLDRLITIDFLGVKMAHFDDQPNWAHFEPKWSKIDRSKPVQGHFDGLGTWSFCPILSRQKSGPRLAHP